MSKRRSVLVVSSSFPFGHGESFLTAELNALVDEGFRVAVVPLWPRGVRQVHPGLSPAVKISRLSRRRATLSWRVWEALRNARNARPSTVAGRLRDSSRELMSAALASALNRVAADLGANHLHAYWATGPATTCMLASEVSGISWSFTAHSWDISGNALLAEKCERASGARFISQFGLNRAALCGSNISRAQVVHLGVTIPSRDFRSDGIRLPVRIACPANLTSLKGHRYLVEGIHRLRLDGIPAQLTLLGEGQTRSALEAQVAELGLADAVQIEGQVAHHRLLAMYKAQRFDMVVLPSVEEAGRCEGIPVALMEAMAHSLPVIGTRTGGIPELIPEGFGLLVPPADPSALADAIKTLTLDAAVYGNASDSCYRSVATGFDSKIQGTRLASFLKGCSE